MSELKEGDPCPECGAPLVWSEPESPEDSKYLLCTTCWWENE